MAKARNTTPAKVRAIKAWFKANHCERDTNYIVDAWKSRSKKTVTVRGSDGVVFTWSYKGGSLRRVET